VNLIELERALRQLRLGGIAAVLETRLHQAQAEPMAPIDLLSCLVTDELNRRSERLLERRRKQAAFRDPHNTLDNFDFTFNPKMNRSLVFDLGEVVTREQVHQKLWPNGTIVEFDHSINAAIKRLRQALEDSAEAPRYIETLPRAGLSVYRTGKAGAGRVEPVLYFDLSRLSFQVPAKGSAATRVAASPKRANASFAYRIVSLLCAGIIPRGAVRVLPFRPHFPRAFALRGPR
jgi:hypothetical protein